VLDLDVQKFFDSVDHDLMVKAVEANTDQKWVVLYVKRWLKAPIQLPDGTVAQRNRGTPQGSAVSPVLANLFMHYAFDSWLEREFPTVEFERFADDAVVHCVTERQARQVWAALSERMESVGLRLHPDKTKIVYCKDKNRRQEFECTSFTFLGYTFRPRQAKSGKTGRYFASFQPAISPVALKDKSRHVRQWRIHRHTTDNLADLAEWINPIVRGWMNYYGAFYRSELYGLLQRINTYLMRWARKKFKRLRVYNVANCGGKGLSNNGRTYSRIGRGCLRSHGLDEKSGMTGDCHVPFRGSPGVRFPWATRLRVRRLDGTQVPLHRVRTVCG
jgi:RNA-directed DNA polymerase